MRPPRLLGEVTVPSGAREGTTAPTGGRAPDPKPGAVSRLLARRRGARAAEPSTSSEEM